MFVFGDRTTHIGTEPVIDEKCPNCGAKDSMTIAILSTYAHLFWVPLFPFRKYGAAHCTSCDTAIGRRNMSESLARFYDKVRASIKFPWWNFLAPILILIYLIGNYGYKEINTQIDYRYLNNPNQGDVYILSNGGYSLIKVLAVKNNTIVVTQSKTIIYFRNNIYKLYNSDFGTPFNTTKEKLRELYNAKLIYDIDRN